MVSFFEKQDHIVRYAEDAFTALDVIKDFTPDIIYVDLVMPKISGDILCKILRTMPHLSKTYIVIVSASVLERGDELGNYGANAAIAKGPFSVMSKYLLETVEESDSASSLQGELVVKGSDTFYAREITKDLLSTNNHLLILLESMSQGVMEIEFNRVLYANPAMSKILKIEEEKLFGSYLNETVDTDTWNILSKRISTCQDTSYSEEKNRPIKIYNRHVILQCLQIQGQENKRLVLMTDITERKRMEAVVEATNLTDNLGYIFSGIRHEIGNPVNSIKMALTLLNKHINSYDTETITEFVQRSLLEVERLEYLLKALKNFSLFETPNVNKVSINCFMDNFISLVNNDLSKKNIDLKTMVDEDEMFAFTDDRALHHVLLNLLINAVDAVEKTTFPHITIAVKRESPWIIIKVNDNGYGIPDMDQKNLFKPFFTSKPQGTGLGLVIVQKMLLKMNSKISIESITDFGTTVTVSLPEGT